MKKQYLYLLVMLLLGFSIGWWSKQFYTRSFTNVCEVSRIDSSITEHLVKDTPVYPPPRRKRTKPDTLINDDVELIIKEIDGDVTIWRKYRPKKDFKDFAVREKYTGKIPKQLNFATCKYGRRYRTVTKWGADHGVAFAGHYGFIEWGCGTSCQNCSIIDLTTGNVYAGPDANGGYEYRADSRLLIVNPPDSNGRYYPCFYCIPIQYVWTGNSFKKLDS